MDWLMIVGGFALLVLGGEGLVRGAATLALRAGLSPLLVGLTVVGFGTSTPDVNGGVKSGHGAVQNQASVCGPSAMARTLTT